MNDSVDDSELYVIANKEVDTNTQDDALWRKAMALTAGNKEKAKYKYVKLRVHQLKKAGFLKFNVNDEKQSNPIKKEKKVNVDTRYEKERIAEIDETLNKGSTAVGNTSDDNNTLKGIITILVIIAVVIWVININKSSSSSTSTYVETPTQISTNYKKSSYDNEYSLKIDTYPTNATVKIMNIVPEYSYGMYLYEGNYKVQVSAYGYITKTIWINLTKDTNKYVFLSNKTYTDNKFSVNIHTIPANATIKITNIKPKFYQGMRLKKGRYYINVSKQGYITKKQYFDLAENSSYSVTLKKIKVVQKYPLTINVTPSDAKVQIMNIKPKYYDGIMLKKGKYNIRVAKYGYETQENTVNPFEYSTYNVILKKKKTSYSNTSSSTSSYSSNTNNKKYVSAWSDQECYNQGMNPEKHFNDGSVLCSKDIKP